MPSPWLAVGRETDPLSRARQLQQSWERLLAEGALDTDLPPDAMAGLRPTILESWRRSLGTGLDPTELMVPIEADPSAIHERWLEHPLGLARARARGATRAGSRGVAEPGRGERCLRAPPAHRRGRVAEGARGRDEFRGGRTPQRGGRWHERHRDGAGRGSPASGVRFRALQREPPPVVLLRRAGARPGVRANSGSCRSLEPRGRSPIPGVWSW